MAASLPQHFNEIYNICCIGATQASVMSMAVVAQAHAAQGHPVNVRIVDFNFNLMESWINQTIDDLQEPGFVALLNQVVNQTMTFGHDVYASINAAEMIVIGVEIPTKRRGLGAGSRLDLHRWEQAVRAIMLASQESKIIVEKTAVIDVSMDTMRLLSERTQAQQNQVQFAVFSSPDFYRPGQAIAELTIRNQVIIARKSNVGNVAVLQEMYAPLTPNQNIITILPNHVSVELAKISTSLVTAGQTTMTNVISALGGIYDANYNPVPPIVGANNNLMMSTTLGIGGPNVKRDVSHLKHILQQSGLGQQAKLVDQMVKLSKQRIKKFADTVLTEMGTLRNKTLVVFGVTYQANVSDSPAITACKLLLKEGARLHIFDPLTNANVIMRCFRGAAANRVEVFNNQIAAYQFTHAAVCLVDADIQFNVGHMRTVMGMGLQPYWFIACNHNNINYDVVEAAGFNLYRVL